MAKNKSKLAELAAKYPNALTGNPTAAALTFGKVPPPELKGQRQFAPMETDIEFSKRMQNRADRIKRKIDSWDHDTLVERYAWILLLALELRKTARYGNDIAQKTMQESEHYRDIADALAIYGRHVGKAATVQAMGRIKGGREAGKQRADDACARHAKWLREHNDLIQKGRNPRDVAGILAELHGVSSSTIRRGIQSAKNKARTS